jgi:hypothetical protein
MTTEKGRSSFFKKKEPKKLLLVATQLRCLFAAPDRGGKETPELRGHQQKFFARFFSKKRCFLA